MSRAQVTPERIAEIRELLEKRPFTQTTGSAIRDLLAALTTAQDEAQENWQSVKVWKDRAESAERQLATWREWAQFVYGPGGPVEGSDDDLRFRVCAAHEHDKSALQGQLATVTQELAAASDLSAARQIALTDVSSERDALKQERDAMRAALEKYGMHYHMCLRLTSTTGPVRDCDCGYANALGGEER